MLSARQSNIGNPAAPSAPNAPRRPTRRNVRRFCMFSSHRPSSASSRRSKRCGPSLPHACDRDSARSAGLPKRKCGRSLHLEVFSPAPARSRRDLTKIDFTTSTTIRRRQFTPTTRNSRLFLSQKRLRPSRDIGGRRGKGVPSSGEKIDIACGLNHYSGAGPPAGGTRIAPRGPPLGPPCCTV
jgi:hypothetical protein